MRVRRKKKGRVLSGRTSVTVIETIVHEQTRSTKIFTTWFKIIQNYPKLINQFYVLPVGEV